MTPALDLLKKVRAEHRVHSYEHDPKAASYGLEAAEKLGLEPAQVFKTLLAVTEKGELLVAVVPVVGSLDLKALAHAAGAKKVEMADPAAAQRALELMRRNLVQPPMSIEDVLRVLEEQGLVRTVARLRELDVVF